MQNINSLGSEWLISAIDDLTDHIDRITPVDFNESHRYLPESVTSIPGPLSYDVNPFMREIVDCFDVNNDVREVSLKKGAQITYTTVLESGLLYLMAYVKTCPIMYVTADKELANSRIENNILPMLAQSGFSDIIRSSDDGNLRKTGKTMQHLQFEGGGFLIPAGAQNANKMRDRSMLVVLKDEIDAWPLTVGKDGDPDALTDARCQGFWDRRKIFRGSTPTIKGISKIEAAYKRGDQRKYRVLCQSCNAPQHLVWKTVDKDSGIIGGFIWETEGGILIPESVHYACQFCGHAHYEHHKEKLFSEKHGAHWKPTAASSERGVRSYHLPALYSPLGMAPWSSLVIKYLKSYDQKTQKVTDLAAYQVFYNNILAEPFDVSDRRVKFTKVLQHKVDYRLGVIPTDFAVKHSEGPIELLFCCVDVHRSNLAVSIVGFTASRCVYLIDYNRMYAKFGDCSNLEDPVWAKLTDIIYDKKYLDNHGREYKIACTLIDSGFINDVVISYCSNFEFGVYPIRGRQRAAKNQKVIEFESSVTKIGVLCYSISVDHYKDRLEYSLSKTWSVDDGEPQPQFHFNAPFDTTDAQLRELTVEYKRSHVDSTTGVKTYAWYRPANANNELFDLLVYSHACLEIVAYTSCIEAWQLTTVEWPRFWDHLKAGGSLALPILKCGS